MQPESTLENAKKLSDEPIDLEQAWFVASDAPPPSSVRRSSVPPPVEKVGEFLGDPTVDAWLR